MTLLPPDHFDNVDRPDRDELATAAKLGREHLGEWVQVGDLRFVAKDHSAWCSEVRLGQKAVLGGHRERWEARDWPTGVVDDQGRLQYGKAIRFMGLR